MKTVKFLGALTLMIHCSVGVSQTQLPAEFKVFTPECVIESNNNRWARNYSSWQEYALGKIKNTELGKPRNKIAWIVYSDRDRNTTYDSPNGSSLSTLNFMDKVYIAEIKNGYAHVFTDENINTYPTINPTATSKGWIPVDNLLLWDKCPQNKNLIFSKGLVVGDPSKNTNIVQNPPYITCPEEQGNKNGTANKLDILFIMKTVQKGGKTYYLLAKEISVKDRRNVVAGWLSEDYITLWDQRLCLEPTTASQNFDYYKNLGLFPAVYRTSHDAANLVSSKQQGNPFWIYREFSKERMNSYTMRSPILNKEKDNIFSVASIASIDGAAKKNEQTAENTAQLERLKDMLKTINIIFVIDATNSMKNYYTSVANALSDIMKKDWEGKRLNVGAVLYRNAADGSKEIEYQKLSSNINAVINFIASAEVGSVGKTHYESFYKGLETALDTRKMGYASAQSNFMIVIGDAGNLNNNSQNEASDIVRKMSENRINLLGFQVNHANADAYDDFAIQMGKIIRETVKQRSEADVEYKLQSNRLYMVQRKNSKASSLIYAGYKFANPGKSEQINVLKNNIVSNVMAFMTRVEEQISILNTDGFAGTNSMEETQLREILQDFGWSQQRITNYISELKQGGVTKLIGSAPIKVNHTNFSLFDYVLFFSADELANIIKELKKLESQSHLSDRKAYQDAVIAMGQAFLGQMTRDDLMMMGMDELISQIYGVPIEISNCGVKIEDIPSTSKLPDEKLQNYINDFNTKRRGLENIRDNSYIGKFRSNGLTYIWIPMSDMPGYCAE